MKRSLLTLLALLALAGTVLAGCGDSKKASRTAAPASAGSGGAVTMQNTAFSPTAVTVKVGQKITWTNKDGFDHNVTSDSGASFKSKDFGKDGTFSFTPTKAGTIKYECTIHPGMGGTITVTN